MRISITLIALLSLFQSLAQETFVSPYVIDGKSFEMKIPNGFYDTHSGDNTMAMYSKDPDFNIDSEELPTEDVIVLGLLGKVPEFNEESFREMVDEMTYSDEMNLIEQPSILTRNGQTFYKAAASGVFEGINLHRVYLIASDYKGVMVLCMYLQINSSTDASVKKDLEYLFNNFKEVSTDRENDYFTDEDFNDYDEYDMSDEFYQNSMYETGLAYEDVFFEEGESDFGWEENYDESFPELLLAYQYWVEDDADIWNVGGVKVFSGGDAESYASSAAKLEALQAVFPYNNITDISLVGDVAGETHSFKKYRVVSNSEDPKTEVIYTTEYAGELVFILIETYEGPSDEFISAYEPFVKTLWFMGDDE